MTAGEPPSRPVHSRGGEGEGPGPDSARRKLVWAILISGLLAVAIIAINSYLQPGPPALDRYGEAPSFALTDQNGERFPSRELRGKVWMADFIFTRCGGLCPALGVRMRAIQEDLRDREGWALVSFSVDPEFDTPEVLREYAGNLGADPDRWTFLTGERDTIYAISIEGFHLGVSEDGSDPVEPILHSQRIVLVDRENTIRGYYDGLDSAAMAALVRDAGRLLEEPR